MAQQHVYIVIQSGAKDLWLHHSYSMNIASPKEKKR